MKKKTVFGKIIIVGRTNVGKSTLLNKLIKSKISITSHKINTTQKYITGIYTSDHIQYEIIDSPGLQNQFNNVEKKKIHDTINLIKEANIVIFLITSFIWTKKENKLLKYIQKKKVRYILVINKIDRIKDKKLLLPFLYKMSILIPNNEIFLISAKKDILLKNLIKKINILLPESNHQHLYNKRTTCTKLFLISELIRETLINLLNQELVYSFKVSIIKFYKNYKNEYIIFSNIFVKNIRHKKIVIGLKGKKIEQCRIYASIKIEKFLKKKIYLNIQVKHK